MVFSWGFRWFLGAKFLVLFQQTGIHRIRITQPLLRIDFHQFQKLPYYIFLVVQLPPNTVDFCRKNRCGRGKILRFQRSVEHPRITRCSRHHDFGCKWGMLTCWDLFYLSKKTCDGCRISEPSTVSPNLRWLYNLRNRRHLVRNLGVLGHNFLIQQCNQSRGENHGWCWNTQETSETGGNWR